MTILRMAGQVALVIGAFWATLSVDPVRGERFLVDAAQSGSAPKDLVLWMLGAMVLIAALSLSRGRVSGFASTLAAWCESHRQWLFAAGLGGAALGVCCLI